MNTSYSLTQLGWQPYYQQQLSLEEFETATIARVMLQHRSEYVLQTESKMVKLQIQTSMPKMVVGDWLLLDNSQQFLRLLARKSLFKRKAAGNQALEQLIASNVDTLLIVSSLNEDYNLNRIERYLAIAHEAEAEPVVVLSKRDLCIDPEQQIAAVQKLDTMLTVIAVNGLNAGSCEELLQLCRAGKTLALVGSSGVGKSTLVNTLMQSQTQKTADIREGDDKGRHTTTSRSMHFLPSGAVLIDTPGMRELQLTDCESGVSHTFADIEALAAGCRFSDCSHDGEPGCAVVDAIERGELEARKLLNYQKLRLEQLRNGTAIHERRAKDKAFAKMVKNVTGEARHNKKGY